MNCFIAGVILTQGLNNFVGQVYRRGDRERAVLTAEGVGLDSL